MLIILLGMALAAPLSPDAAVAAALSSNPDLARAEGELGSAQGAARQSALLRENPEIQAGYGLVGGRFDLSLNQPLSLTGEGLADHRSQRARVRANEAALGRVRLELAAQTRTAYVEAVVARQLRVLAEQFFELATRQLEATGSRVRAGEAADLDLRLARMEQVKVAQSLLRARNDEAAALATLSTLVQRPLTGEDLAADPLDAAPEPQPAADGERSDVQAARLSLEAAEAAVRRERAAALPPVSLGAFVEQEGGNIIAGPSLGLTLPIWHQNQAGVAEANAQAGIARAELESTTARAAAEQQTATFAYSQAVSTLSLVPATADDATAALASIEAGVRSGELDLVTTILLRAEVISGQQALAEARGDLAISRLLLLLATEDNALLSGGSQ